MSDICNHYFCGLEVIKRLDLETKSRIHPKMFFLGAQGPDIFLYYNVMHFQQPISYGNAIHHMKIDLFFYNMYKYIASIDEEDLYDKLFSYLCGFACHHALDSITHPFIIYHSGIYDKHNKNTRVYQYMHKKYEVLLDVAMLKHEYDLIANEFKMDHIFVLDYESILLLESLYETVLQMTYSYSTASKVVINSIKSQKVILSFLNNPDNIKGRLLATLERVFLKNGYATTAMYPRETQIDFILNLDNKVWSHPYDENRNYNSSYIDLFHRSVDQGIKNIDSLSKLKNTDFTVEHIHDIFQDISYLTGDPWMNSPSYKRFNKVYADKLITL